MLWSVRYGRHSLCATVSEVRIDVGIGGVPLSSHRLLILLPIRLPEAVQLPLHASTHS